jgi:hypothetical protein
MVVKYVDSQNQILHFIFITPFQSNIKNKKLSMRKNFQQ